MRPIKTCHLDRWTCGLDLGEITLPHHHVVLRANVENRHGTRRELRVDIHTHHSSNPVRKHGWRYRDKSFGCKSSQFRRGLLTQDASYQNKSRVKPEQCWPHEISHPPETEPEWVTDKARTEHNAQQVGQAHGGRHQSQRSGERFTKNHKRKLVRQCPQHDRQQLFISERSIRWKPHNNRSNPRRKVLHDRTEKHPAAVETREEH